MFARPKRAVGVDLGTHSIKLVELVLTGGRPAVSRAVKVQVDPAQMVTDPMTAQVSALRTGLSDFDPTGAVYVAALSGQSVVIRYPRLPKMPKEEIPGAIEIEAAQNIPYEMEEIVMDSVILEEVAEHEQTLLKVLLVAARRELVDARLAILHQAGIAPHIMGIDSLALTDAIELAGALPTDESVALINIGAATVNIHFCRDGISSFIRDISWGTREIRAALQRAYKVEPDAAEQMIELTGRSPTVPTDSASVPTALGGASPLEPLPEEAVGPESEPVEPPPSEQPAPPAEQVPYVDEQMVTAVRPAIMRFAGEIRRSFDYYEQQLYERSVGQIILSGGGAEFLPLRQIVAEELSVASLELANPIGDRILVIDEGTTRDLLEHPAQFVVAVGLAGRGLSFL